MDAHISILSKKHVSCISGISVGPILNILQSQKAVSAYFAILTAFRLWTTVYNDTAIE